MELTSRQRLLRLWNGQEIDRVPIWLLAPYHPLEYYADIYNIPAYRPVTAAIERFCDTMDRRRPDLGFCYNANPEILRTSIDGPGRTGTRVTYRDLTFEKSVTQENGYTTIKFYVDEPDMLEKIAEIPYIPPCPDRETLLREKEELGERGLLMMDLGDPLEPLYHLCSAENFCIWTLTDLDSLLRFTDVMAERVLEVYRRYLELDIADAYFIVGAEFAGPPMVDPKLFNTLSSRYLKRVVDLIHQYGKIAIIHYHGNLSRVLEGFKEVEPDGLHTIEAPPVGDCTITQARSALGPHTVLIGNIQYDDLERRSQDEIRQMVRDVMEEGKAAGRFILSPTAGPYCAQPSARLIQNYLAFIEAGIRYGKL